MLAGKEIAMKLARRRHEKGGYISEKRKRTWMQNWKTCGHLNRTVETEKTREGDISTEKFEICLQGKQSLISRGGSTARRKEIKGTTLFSVPQGV